MTLPIPRCLACGEEMKHAARTVVQYMTLPGRPQVGWHLEAGCVDDPLVARIIDRRPRADLPPPSLERDTERLRLLVELLREVEARGENRLSAGSLWRKSCQTE